MLRIYYENITDKPIPVSYLPIIKRVINRCIKAEYPCHHFELNLTICDNTYIRELNHKYRNIDAATDVLSFPFYDFNTPEIMTLLGDIVISIEKAREQAYEYGHSLKRELCFLAAHSSLHLLGYDHESEEERLIMEQKQREILDALKITR